MQESSRSGNITLLNTWFVGRWRQLWYSAHHRSDPPELQEDNFKWHFMASNGQRREKEAQQQWYFSAAGIVRQTEKRRERKIWKLNTSLKRQNQKMPLPALLCFFNKPYIVGLLLETYTIADDPKKQCNCWRNPLFLLAGAPNYVLNCVALRDRGAVCVEGSCHAPHAYSLYEQWTRTRLLEDISKWSCSLSCQLVNFLKVDY